MKRAIIVDDEQAAIKKLERMLTEVGGIEICGAFSDPAAVPGFIKDNPVDIAFLDIEMPRLGGIELADRLIDIQSGIHIVFVTAYSEYAVEAFRCHALDYLLKPVSRQRLEVSLSRLAKPVAPVNNAPRRVQVNCFGRLSVTIDGEPLRFRTAKAEELFAYLIDNNGQPVHRNHIMDAFWSDSDGDRALILFNTTLHYLKKAFLTCGVRLNVVHQRGSYALDMTDIVCDAVSFAGQSAQLKAVTAQNAEQYEQTAALYTGAYFGENEYGWAHQKAIKFCARYARLTHALAVFHADAGNEQKALELLTAAIVYAPLDKNVNYLLLSVLKKRGDTVAFQSYYKLYQNRLAEEYGLEPERAIDALLKAP